MTEIVLAFLIILIGLYGLMFSKNIIRTIISFEITQSAIVLMFVFIGKTHGEMPPILKSTEMKYVDPLPQALMITVIVIGAAITAVLLLMSVKVFHYYGTLEWKDIISDERNNRK